MVKDRDWLKIIAGNGSKFMKIFESVFQLSVSRGVTKYFSVISGGWFWLLRAGPLNFVRLAHQ